MRLFIEKHPEFISVRKEHAGNFDQRVLIVKPGEELTVSTGKLSYTALKRGPCIVDIFSMK